MKVTLILPNLNNNVGDIFDKSWVIDVARPLFRLGKSNHTPPLSLLVLAAVTPPHVEIQIIDERVEPICFDDDVDLVGITINTRSASRAYEIADKYRQRGVTVAAGGIHPSVMPDEVLEHVDVVVIGEGESTWPQLLNDFSKQNLQQIYKGERQRNLDLLPFPRRDLLRHPEAYLTTKVITATRGCQNSCTFCAAGFAVSKHFRTRSVELVVEELNQIPGDVVFFLDDNLGWDQAYFKKFLRALIPLNIKWMGAVFLPAIEDLETVELMAKSGCVTALIGFESIRPATILEMKKQRTNDPERYHILIQRLQKYHIPIRGQFIVGFDSDDENIFHETIDFINETRIELPTVNTLIPYPGTPVYRKFLREGRLLTQNWDQYDTAGGYVLYEPKQMSAQRLMEGYLEVVSEIYSPKSIIKRLSGVKLFNSGIFPSLFYNFAEHHSANRFAEFIAAGNGKN